MGFGARALYPQLFTILYILFLLLLFHNLYYLITLTLYYRGKLLLSAVYHSRDFISFNFNHYIESSSISTIEKIYSRRQPLNFLNFFFFLFFFFCC